MELIDSSTNESIKFESGKVYHWYNCGPTIYNRSHLGHVRTFSLF